MKYFLRYGIFIFFFTCAISSCSRQKILNKRVSFWRMDEIPYGTKYAYDNLPAIFPNADIRSSHGNPDFFSNENGDDTIRALIVVTQRFAADSDEMNALIRFASFGNQVFISSLDFEDTVMDMLHLKWSGYDFPEKDSTEISLLNPVTRTFDNFGYPGYSNESFFNDMDTGFAEVLGKNNNGKPDFIRIPYPQGGAIYIHLNPFAFSNFFLLHKKNKSYYDWAFSNLPEKTGVVEWSDYFRYSKKSDFSAFQFIKKNPALRWAFWLTLLLFGLLFLVDSKRKQRSITETAERKNASVDFVKTVGRLYFQQKNNQNLAAKMVAAFLENIRSAYNLSTSLLNEDFAQKLAFRSGRPETEIRQMVHTIHEIRLKPGLSDQELMDLHQQISQFNKQAL